MNERDYDYERRREAAFRRLGTRIPRCVHCGEGDWRCLELHHLAGRAYDDRTAILCRNCHRKLSDPSDNAIAPAHAPLLERAGHFIIGLVEFLLAMLPKLREFGEELLRGAVVCPWPWGWEGAPT